MADDKKPFKPFTSPLGIDFEEERRRKFRTKIFGIYSPKDDLDKYDLPKVKSKPQEIRVTKKKKTKIKRRAKKASPHENYLEELRYLANQKINGKCNWCPARHDLTYDHIYPKSKDGCNCKFNIQILCRRCNSQKGDAILLGSNGKHFGHTKDECPNK